MTVCSLLASVLLTIPAGAQEWRSPLWGRAYFLVEKPSLESGAFLPLPSKVQAELGVDLVEYEAFTVAYLAQERNTAVLRELDLAGLRYQNEIDRWKRLAVRPRGSEHAGSAPEAAPRAIPDLYLARFAFPVRQEWLSGASGCSAEVLAIFDPATVLLRTRAAAGLPSCGGFRHLAWLRPFLATDRAVPDFGDAKASDSDQYSIQFFPGASAEVVSPSLPAGVEVLAWDRSPMTGMLTVQVTSSKQDLTRILDERDDVLAVSRDGHAAPSDERQGLILASLHDGTKVTAPGYLAWLAEHGLATSANQQTVAVFDTGYDDGTGAGPHHPDLETPRRLRGGNSYVPGTTFLDTGGHGTMVAGIIAGSGGHAGGALDCQGYQLGTGIAPLSRIVAVKIFHYSSNGCGFSSATSVPTLRSAFAFSRNTTTGADKALLSNHSWNAGAGYTPLSALYDEMVVDANSNLAGAQPMTVVVSADNDGANNNTCSPTPIPNSVTEPATAKNVITVGATENYRPAAQACQPATTTCGTWCPLLIQDATNVNRLAHFSSKGRYFERFDIGDPPLPNDGYAHTVRIKPDVVAPGVRIVSTVPYQEPGYTCRVGTCSLFFNFGLSTTYHTYAQGTSFAAPAVTGAAALLRKHMLDNGVGNPAPSLIKAGLIATADDIGSFAEYGGDHRPSYLYGWGRVNLNRATNNIDKYYVNEDPGLAVGTGQERSFPVTVDNVAKDTFIVLAWSDPPSDATGEDGEALLKNDLRLTVLEGSSTAFWRGNNFRENKDSGVDNGYSYRFVVGGDPTLEDAINTVEAVFIPANTFQPGKQLTIKVTGMAVAAGPQMFSVYGFNLR